jgi:hypothetical protein
MICSWLGTFGDEWAMPTGHALRTPMRAPFALHAAARDHTSKHAPPWYSVVSRGFPLYSTN